MKFSFIALEFSSRKKFQEKNFLSIAKEREANLDQSISFQK